MKYFREIFVLVMYLFSITTAQSQEHHHSHLENEIGLSGGAVYCPDHSEWGATVHMHYFRMLNPHSKWSLGGMLEKTWTDDSHFTIGAGVKYQIIDRLTVGLLPGISFLKHEDDTKYSPNFSLHLEMVYDLFHWEKFHLGPVIDYSWAKHDSHIAAGIHAAYCF